MIFKVISWNINSMRKRRNNIIQLIQIEKPDFLLLQETRCESYDPIENYYNYHHSSNKGRNGVAILSRYPLEIIEMEYERYIHCKFNEISIICVYIYNGGSILSPPDKKIEFLHFLSEKVQDKNNCIIGGDFNVLYNHYEFWNSNPYSEEEIEALKYFESKMLFHPSQEKYYTWWDYRNQSFQKNLGMGLDKFYYKGVKMTPPQVLKKYREYSIIGIPSDHAPISSMFYL